MPHTIINDVALSYDERGDRNAPTIIFTHALAADRRTFHEVAEQLSDYHLLLLDVHGHGESGYPASFSLGRMADDCAALIRVLEVAPVCWVGESVGGMIGIRLALAHPECLRSLVLINTSAQAEVPEAREIYLHMSREFRDGRTNEVAQAMLPLLFCEATVNSWPDIIENYVTEFTRERDREGVYQAALAVFEREDITGQLSRISTPTLVLSGVEDKTNPLPCAQNVAQKIPDAKLQLIPNSGHMSAVEQPHRVAKAIREFLEE
jgi:pimeloyl-ACP methyl ester carboxylesterase